MHTKYSHLSDEEFIRLLLIKNPTETEYEAAVRMQMLLEKIEELEEFIEQNEYVFDMLAH